MISSNNFSIINGELIIQSNESKEVLWRGKPFSISVEQVLPVPGSTDLIVLLNWRKAGIKNIKNLLRLNAFGIVKWEVGTPSKISPPGPERGKGVYTQIRLEDIHLTAFSYSGYLDSIELGTGRIINSIFVK